jgi:integrase
MVTSNKRKKTTYPGVFYRESKRIGGSGTEKVYYIVFKKNGKLFEEKVGRQYVDGMTPARANRIRSDRIEGRRLSRKEIRQKKNEKIWTFDQLWEKYKEDRPENKSLTTDNGRYKNYLKQLFGDKKPSDVVSLDIQRLKKQKLDKKSPQTIKHVLSLLTRIANYGKSEGLNTGITFKIRKPVVDNKKTEDLSPTELKTLKEKIEESDDIQAGNVMKLALYTGMRRGEILKLKHEDVDFHRGFIHIREPKGRISQTIPLNEKAQEVFQSIPQTSSSYIFSNPDGSQMKNVTKRENKIKEAAGLPANFRALHGLRHVFASMLASSGNVDMHTLQKLLTHKDPRMTQRYSYLRDETLRNVSGLVGPLVDQAVNEVVDQEKETVQKK